MACNINSLTAILFFAAWSPAYSQQYSTFESDFVSFSYPSLYYSGVTIYSPANLCGDSGGTCLEAYYIKLNRRKMVGGLDSDSGSICVGSVSDCAQQQPDFGYYIDVDGKVSVAPPGEKQILSKAGQWDVIESYPLCGWSDLKTGFSPYGGQCFSVVLMGKSKTIGFSFLLGKAGCRNVLKCWPAEMSRIRKLVSSVK